MSTSDSLDPRALHEHATWLRALARSLERDPGLAEDLAQDTLVAALERPPRDDSSPRAWLSTVLRNLVRQRRRGERRRAARERRRPATGSAPATDDLLQRATLNQQLAQAVMDLEEPFRRTILLRFFEGLPPREISAEMDVPVATVHSRLRRGFQRLRERMDDAHDGHRGAWLLPLVAGFESARPHWPGASGLGALLMSLSSKTALTALALAAVGVCLWTVGSTGTEPAQSPSLSPDGPPVVNGDAPRVEEAEGVRDVRRAMGAPAIEEVDPAPPTVLLSGVVLNPASTPVAGVPVVFAPAGAGAGGEWTVTSDATGGFELRVPELAGRVRATGPDWSNVMTGHFDPESALEPVVVVAPRVELAGVVVDPGGRAVPGATVRQVVPEERFRAFGVVLDSSRPFRVQGTADAEGRFTLPDGFALEGALLVTEHGAYQPDERLAPLVGTDGLRIELGFPTDEDGTLLGVVLDSGGGVVPDAWVSLGSAFRRTDESGAFRFEAEDVGEEGTLRVVAMGRLPGKYEAHLVEGRPAWPPFVTVVLEGEPASLSGKVVDREGHPVPGARVWVDGVEWFGSAGEDAGWIEYLLGGATTDEELEAAHTNDAGELDVEAFLAARSTAPSPTWGWVATDSRGRFLIEGLQHRSYHVAVLDGRTLERHRSDPITVDLGPRPDTTLVVQGPAHLPVRRGRVQTPDGSPVAGARVSSIRRAVEIERPDGSITSYDHAGPAAITDVEGAFDLGPLAREGVRLRVQGPGLRARTFDASELDALGEPLVLTLLRDVPPTWPTYRSSSPTRPWPIRSPSSTGTAGR